MHAVKDLSRLEHTTMTFYWKKMWDSPVIKWTLKHVAESGNKDRKKYIVETCSKLGVLLLSGLYVELFRGTNSIKWYVAWGM